MARRLAEREPAVMAATARSDRLGMIDELRLLPRRRDVATAAEISRERMSLDLAPGSRAIVAAETFSGRSAEAPADMT